MAIRILHVVTIMNRGGEETMIMNYYRKINRNNVQFDFLVHREEEGIYEEEIKSLGGKIYRAMPIRPGNYHKYFKFLDDFLKEHKEFSIIHSHIQENSGFILNYGLKNKIPVRIAHSHSAPISIDYKWIFRKYAQIYLKKSVNYRFSCGEAAGKWLYKDKPFTIVNNAIDTKKYTYNKNVRNNMRKELQISDETFVLGHVGRFDKAKNQDFIVDVFFELLKKNKNAVLILVGTGNTRSNIEEKVNNYNIADKVKLLGVREDVNNLLQVFDAFIFPSLFEGLPVTVIEAQASGLKCFLADNITEEVVVTDLVEFLSLKKGAEYWSDEIFNKASNYIREDQYEAIKDANYDISNNAEWLEQFYLTHDTKRGKTQGIGKKGE